MPRWLDRARRDDAGMSTLIRLVDDSLMVSTRQADATGFLAAMQRGCPDYGCRSNPAIPISAKFSSCMSFKSMGFFAPSSFRGSK